MTTNKSVSITPASATKLDLYLDRLAAHHTPPGRLIFALDATASREPTWDAAVTLTAAMFAAVTALDVQLVYYRGVNECRSSSWVSDGRVLTNLMSKVRCAAGMTQVERILDHARKENAKQKVSALVFVGDAFEEEADAICVTARELGLPVFLFQEGDDEEVAKVFGDIARLTKGAHCQFGKGSAKELASLLGAVAAYAAGGRAALENRTDAGAVRLLQQLKS
jgi:hypothetical protein